MALKLKLLLVRNLVDGERATFIISEEFRIMDKSKYDSIVKPFSYARQTPYLKLPEYASVEELIEEPKEVLISSAYYKSEWWYKYTADIIKMMMKGQKCGFIAFDYLIAIKHNIKTKNVILKEKGMMGAIMFQQEYLNLPFGSNESAYFPLELFKGARNIRKAFYPQKNVEYDAKRNPYDIKKVDGELRVVSVDVATRKGEGNDNTIISCTRLLPTNNGYHRDVCYMESHNGENTLIQALRIKQIFYDFSADYTVLDIQNAGIALYDMFGNITEDSERGIEYPAWTVFRYSGMEDKLYDELTERTLSLNAEPIIVAIAASAKINNDIAVSMRDKLKRGMISFLSSETDADEYLSRTKKDYTKYDEGGSARSWYLHPYAQMDILVNEMVALSMELVSGNIKLKEPTGGRKDRYTSVSYMNYFASTLDINILKEKKVDNFSSILNCVAY